MTYDEALEYIHSAPKFSKELGNRALKIILERLGNPENDLKFIHIAGTNGKGSTAAMTESIFRRAGYKTGLFTSPFIERFNERIRFCGDEIDDLHLADFTERVVRCMEENDTYLSEFAIIFVISLLYFKERKCDIVVLEAGLGGRLDATNAINKAEIEIITKIGLDHMQYLGNTKESIALEKCGIIKENSVVVTNSEQDGGVMEVIRRCCDEKNARLLIAENPDFLQAVPSLGGDFQKYNAAAAACSARALGIGEDVIKYGIEHTFWPGRFEWITDRILLDGCHNADGAAAFSKSAQKINKSMTIVTCAMEDKDTLSIAHELSEVTDSVVVTKLDMPRAAACEKYADDFKNCGVKAKIIENPYEAIKYALSKSDVCAVCGSLYLIGEVRGKINSFKRKELGADAVCR